MRGVARPVAAGGDDLARDQRVGLESACGAEVVHLPAAVAGAAQLDGDVGGGDAPVRERRSGAGTADREPALAGDHVVLVDADVDHVGRPVENRCARRQFERLAVALDGAAAGQRQDHHLGVAGVQLDALCRPSSSSTTCRLDSVQPADSGVTSTVYGVSRCAPGCTTCCARRHAHHLHGGRHGGGDVVVGRVEQRAADDQAAHRGSAERLLPAGERLVGIGRGRRRAAASASSWPP